MFAPSQSPDPREPGASRAPHSSKISPEQGRQQLVEDFSRLVASLDFTMCSPAKERIDTPEMRERLVRGEPQAMCRRFVSDCIGLMRQACMDGNIGLSSRLELEGMGKSADGKRAICLVDAYDARTGEFVAPLDLERISAAPPEIISVLRMPGASEMIAAGTGLVGRFESSAWGHPTVGIMYTREAYEEASKRLDSIGELLATRRSHGDSMTTEIPVASSLMSLILKEAEKKVRIDALMESAIYGPDELGGNKILGVTRLERSAADGTLLLGTLMLGDNIKSQGSLLLAEPVERTHRIRLARDEFGMVSAEILDCEDRKL